MPDRQSADSLATGSELSSRPTRRNSTPRRRPSLRAAAAVTPRSTGTSDAAQVVGVFAAALARRVEHLIQQLPLLVGQVTWVRHAFARRPASRFRHKRLIQCERPLRCQATTPPRTTMIPMSTHQNMTTSDARPRWSSIVRRWRLGGQTRQRARAGGAPGLDRARGARERRGLVDIPRRGDCPRQHGHLPSLLVRTGDVASLCGGQHRRRRRSSLQPWPTQCAGVSLAALSGGCPPSCPSFTFVVGEGARRSTTARPVSAPFPRAPGTVPG
jgi:hypothetical protein